MNATFCRHLRTKKMYIPAQADDIYSAAGEEECRCGHCWCNRTMAEVGPDDRQVGAQICNTSRTCFED